MTDKGTSKATYEASVLFKDVDPKFVGSRKAKLTVDRTMQSLVDTAAEQAASQISDRGYFNGKIDQVKIVQNDRIPCRVILSDYGLPSQDGQSRSPSNDTVPSTTAGSQTTAPAARNLLGQ